MKKILSILCVLALLFTTTVIAFAEDAEVGEVGEVGGVDTIVDEDIDDVEGDDIDTPEIPVDEIVAGVEKAVSDIAAGLDYLLTKAGVPTLEEVISVVCNKISADTGINIDVSEVTALLAARGIDVSAIKVITADKMASVTQAIFDIIGEKYGQDKVDAVYDILKNSKIVNLFARLYVRSTPSTTEPTTEPTTVPETDPTTVAPVQPEVVPATGEASVFAGIAVLAVAAAAAVVCTKKAKKDEE